MLMRRCARFFSRRTPVVVVYLYRAAMRLLLSTCRWQIKGLPFLEEAALRGKCSLILWHDRLLLLAPALMRSAPQFHYVAAVSNSSEGRLLERLAHSYNHSALRIPHDKKSAALKQIVQLLREGEKILILTPDGPKGPRRHIKPGIAFAALYTGATVVPMTWKASRCWHLRTWDQLAIPKPFSRIEVVFGCPHTFDGDVPLNIAIKDLEAIMET